MPLLVCLKIIFFPYTHIFYTRISSKIIINFLSDIQTKNLKRYRDTQHYTNIQNKRHCNPERKKKQIHLGELFEQINVGNQLLVVSPPLVYPMSFLIVFRSSPVYNQLSRWDDVNRLLHIHCKMLQNSQRNMILYINSLKQNKLKVHILLDRQVIYQTTRA